MTRVTIVTASAVPGGAERALAGLVRHLPASGVEPQAILLQPGALEEWLAAADCPTVVLSVGRTRQLHHTASAVTRIKKLIAEQRADVLLSSQSKSHVYGGAAAALSRIPAVWWQHEIPRRNRIEMTAARIPAAAVVCGSSAAEAAQRRITPHREILRIPPGIDVEAVSARRGSGAAIRRMLGWQDNPIIGIVGRLQPSKGQIVFLHAAALLARARPGLRFAVVGGAVLGWEGSYPDDLQRLARELGLADRTYFAGHQDDVSPWFDALDVVVHAATNEPFGLVVVEAMALGKPLVASAAGGPADIVEHGISGLLVSPGKAEEIASAVSSVLNDPALAAGLSAAAERRARLFSERQTTARFARLLTTVASSWNGNDVFDERGDALSLIRDVKEG